MKLSGTVVFVSNDERKIVIKHLEGYALFRLKKPADIDPGALVKAKVDEDGAGKIKRGNTKTKSRFIGNWSGPVEAVAKAQQNGEV